MINSGRLGLLGLGVRSGQVVIGTSGVREALQRGEVNLVVVAQNCSPRTEEKVSRLARAKGIPLLEGPPADELGRRLGRDSIQAVGVRDPKLAAGIRGEEAKDH